MPERRVVITGLGGLCSVGHNMAEIWDGILNGQSGIRRIVSFDPSPFRTQIAGEVRDWDVTDHIDRKEARRLDPFCHYAVVTAEEAIAESGLLDTDLDLERVGVLVGSGIGGIRTIEEQHQKLLNGGPSRVSPFIVPMMIGDMAAGAISIRHGFQGPNWGLVSACATGAHALGEAYHVIHRGDADVMIAGGTEACVTPLAVAGFSSMKALSTCNDEPERASRPFDATRDGFVLAEGAATLVLETLEHALARGADIKAELIGYGASGDGHHITSPTADGNGAVKAIQRGLAHAGISPADVQYINAHGTSTVMNDRIETLAIRTVFGDAANQVAVSSTKSLTGHTLGAAGALESAFCVKSIEDGMIPATFNYQEPDPNCDLDIVPNKSRKVDVNVAINMNFGFGGHNAVVVFRKYNGE